RAPAAAFCALLCARRAHRRAWPPRETSRFPAEYTLLRGGGPNELWRVYRNPQVHWHAYRAVLPEPVTLWRSGRKSLDPVPQEDLLRLVTDFQGAVRTALGEGFPFVEQPGPGVMRIRLAITDARAADPVLDVLRASQG